MRQQKSAAKIGKKERHRTPKPDTAIMQTLMGLRRLDGERIRQGNAGRLQHRDQRRENQQRNEARHERRQRKKTPDGKAGQ